MCEISVHVVVDESKQFLELEEQLRAVKNCD